MFALPLLLNVLEGSLPSPRQQRLSSTSPGSAQNQAGRDINQSGTEEFFTARFSFLCEEVTFMTKVSGMSLLQHFFC